MCVWERERLGGVWNRKRVYTTPLCSIGTQVCDLAVGNITTKRENAENGAHFVDISANVKRLANGVDPFKGMLLMGGGYLFTTR